jgi:hypothetical protein
MTASRPGRKAQNIQFCIFVSSTCVFGTPACTESHEGCDAVSIASVRRSRAILAAGWAGGTLQLTDEERGQTEEEPVGIGPDPVPMLAVAQL